jgi:phenylalanyl-tRNA synthetase beta chain
LITGPLSPEQWALPSKLVDFYDLKGDVENLLSTDASFLKAEMDSLHPGQSAFVIINGKNAGKIGRLSPVLEKKLEFLNPVFLFELDLNALREVELPVFAVPSKFPAIRRDIAIVVKEQVPFEDIQVKIRESSGSLLHQVQLFDIYRGEGIDSGEKSIALALIFQDKTRTLVDSEVDQVIEKILKSLKESFNATLRM